MRQVATIPGERLAKRLADHLTSLGIATRVDSSAAGWIVWIYREEKLDLARQEVQTFLANSDDPKYDAVSKSADAVRREAAKKENLHRRNSISLSGRLNTPSVARCPITYLLMVVSVGVAILTNFGGDDKAIEPFLLSPTVQTHGLVQPDQHENAESGQGELAIPIAVPKWRSTGLAAVKRGQLWRLITPIFLHFGVMHLVFNMLWLYQLGGLIELRKGHLAMAALVLVSALVSNLGEYFWDLQRHGADYPIRFGGMSGVVYALFGYCWMKSDYDPEADMKLPSNTIVWMLIWLVFCMSGAIGPIANAAHVIGLFVGMLIGLTPHLLREWRWW
ncbi:MAG: putative rane protein [Planctomycetota bacterium]|nr:putative rane protein [Planctomycetota bacterium]